MMWYNEKDSVRPNLDWVRDDDFYIVNSNLYMIPNLV